MSFVLSTSALVVEGVSESSTCTKLGLQKEMFLTEDVYDCLNSVSGGFL